MMKQVEVLETVLVAPSKETPREPLWLSNIDIIVPRKHTPLVYYYPAPAQGGALRAGSFAPDRLTAALAGALVPFYPLAGRLGAGPDGRLQIDCTGEGSLLVIARADLTGEEIFKDYVPSPEIRRAFVPSEQPGEAPSPLGMFQVTFLECGGVVLGTAIHHTVLDGVGSFHFVQTWAGLARGLDVAAACGGRLPSHDRTPLRARRPPCPTSDHLAYSPALLTRRARPSVARIFSVSPELLAGIKSRCGSGSGTGGGVSTFCAVTAHLWRCACVARGNAPDSDTRLGLVANVRHRLNPPLPGSFSANAVVRNLVTCRVSDVLDSPLGSVAETIKKAVDSVDDAYARSVVDYLELELGSRGDKKGNHAKAATEQLVPAMDLWCVSWFGLPMYNADFGSGTPRFVAPADMFGMGLAYVNPCADKDKGISVILAMETEYMQCFEKVFYRE